MVFIPSVRTCSEAKSYFKSSVKVPTVAMGGKFQYFSLTSETASMT